MSGRSDAEFRMPRATRFAPDPAVPGPSLAAGDILEVMPAVMAALRSAMRQQLGQTLSVPQFRGLRFIADHGGCSLSDVSGFLGVTLASASAMVDRLVRAGYVVSGVSAVDRRRSALHATRTGRSLMDRVRGGAQADLADVLGDCSAQELGELQAGLAVLQRRFGHA
jgi:DNA-binding MarR family transcriptional regulator